MRAGLQPCKTVRVWVRAETCTARRPFSARSGSRAPRSSAHINPALSANPNDADALELRRGCTPPAPAPAPEPAASAEATPPSDTTVTPELNQVEALITADACAEAVQRVNVNVVLAGDPNNERANELATQAAGCGAATPSALPTAVVRTGALAVKESPSQGGLDLMPKELEKD